MPFYYAYIHLDKRKDKVMRNRELAIELLKGDTPIPEIARLCGYTRYGIYQIIRRAENKKQRNGISGGNETYKSAGATSKERHNAVYEYLKTHTVNDTSVHFGLELDTIRSIKRILKTKEESERPCAVCGKVTSNPKYCSVNCRERARKKRVCAYRRRTVDDIDEFMINPEITMEGVFERYRGICNICGERCDQEDAITTDDGVFIVGKRYPSIDHIKPLSKGGVHSWDNVQLAHIECNSRKGENDG